MAVATVALVLKRLEKQRRNPAVEVWRLASAFDCSAQQIEPILGELIERGRVAVWPDPRGVRRVAVLPPEAGRKVKRKARAVIAEKALDLGQVVDHGADDPASVVEALEEIRLKLERQAERSKGLHRGRQAKGKERSGDVRLREPVLILLGCHPWPPPLAVVCTVCNGAVRPGAHCAWCDGSWKQTEEKTTQDLMGGVGA
jgi:hypothetical protein